MTQPFRIYVHRRPAMLSLGTMAILFVVGGVVVPAAADAPEERYRYSTEEGTVFDSKTGLTWQRAVPSEAYSSDAAMTYCSSGTGLPGTGWRLPSMKELQTIVDESRWSPAIAMTAFPSTPGDPFWTSSPLAGSPNAWGIHFAGGNTFNAHASYAYRVRCVR